MGFTEDMICKDCGKTFSCFFGTNKESFSDFDNIFKNEYGEKAHEQLKLLLNDIETNSEINIDNYNCFLETKYDLAFKTKYLNKKLDDLAEQIEIQDKERTNKNSKFKFVAETFYWKYVEGFNDLKNIIESGDAELIEQAFNEKWVLFEGKRFGHTLFKCPSSIDMSQDSTHMLKQLMVNMNVNLFVQNVIRLCMCIRDVFLMLLKKMNFLVSIVDLIM